ncbi:MAG: hypothetical protein KatS3mg068_1398 [Candidatus Sericytochromatia bacterium]|nr:MAG: hypothetical protein KatS3mg068_1398 [Candidatus Sericytochromatia bacterium]
MNLILDKLVKINKVFVILLIFIINFNGTKFLDLNIESQNADFILDKSTIIFYNKVFIKYKDLQINSDKATIFIDKSSKNILKILIENNVKIITNNSEILAQSIIIEPNTNKMSVIGNIKTKIKYFSNNL